MKIQSKRIYDSVSEADGKRILVDRLWPRGIKKEAAKIDVWLKDISPSHELRKWYHQDIENRWEEFQQKYQAELSNRSIQLAELRQWAQQQQITLLTAAKNQGRNHVNVLIKILENDE